MPADTGSPVFASSLVVERHSRALVILNPDFNTARRALADHPFAVGFLGDAGRIGRLRIDQVIEREPRLSQV
jgi:hypothetical protein